MAYSSWRLADKRYLVTPKVIRADLRSRGFKAVPEEVVQLRDVEVLDLSNNDLALLPQQLRFLTRLKELRLASNKLHVLPSVVLTFERLVGLHLYQNELSSLPERFGLLTTIRVLDLRGNRFATFPSAILSLTQLKELNISQNKIAVVPDNIEKLWQLTDLLMDHNQLSFLPETLGNLSQLRELRVQGNPLACVPECIKKLKRLQTLFLGNFLGLGQEDGYTISELPEDVAKLNLLTVMTVRGGLLTSLPDTFGTLRLKELDFSFNLFAVVPKQVIEVSTLEKLNLCYNRLTSLPDDVYKMQKLKTMILYGNEIKELPPPVLRLSRLVMLNLDHNQLTTLPDDIGKLESLEYLLVSGNNMDFLPEGLCNLKSLFHLNISDNNVEVLPADFGKLPRLKSARHLHTRGNPLVQPPRRICDSGMAAIKSYQEQLQRAEVVRTPRIKLCVFGDSLAGKTSLVYGLMHGKPPRAASQTSRTRVTKINTWDTKMGVEFEVYDFGGNQLYNLLYQHFLTDGAVNVVTVNMQSYNPSRFYSAVGYWLDLLNARSPGSTVLLVGTHADKCKPEKLRDRCGDVQAQVEVLQRRQLQEAQAQDERVDILVEKTGKQSKPGIKMKDILPDWVRERRDRAKALLENRLEIHPALMTVSLGKNIQGITELRNELVTQVSDIAKFPVMRRLVPQTWSDLHKVLQDERRKPRVWLTWRECLRLGQRVGLNIEKLRLALDHLQLTGTLLRFPHVPSLADYVFHDPGRLANVLREALTPSMESVLKEGKVRFPDVRWNDLTDAISVFRDMNFLSTKLLEGLLQPCSSEVHDGKALVSLLEACELCFGVKDDSVQEALFASCHYFPGYQQASQPTDLIDIWAEDLPNHQEQLQLGCQIRGFCPPGLFERWSTRVNRLVQERRDWKDGMVAYRGGVPVLVERAQDGVANVEIVLSARGQIKEAFRMWNATLPLLTHLLELLDEWPGALYSTYVTCAHCLKQRLENPYRYPEENLHQPYVVGMTSVRCPRSMYKESVSAMLVHPQL
ncbi:hypothetical protein Bbelb_011990 [Branchiostoma belcheri]|nr:hypothetical protein Bbelb_011990 [Branchiostoma belcheri]